MSMWDFTPTFDNPVRTEWPAGTTGLYDPARNGVVQDTNSPPAANDSPLPPAAVPSPASTPPSQSAGGGQPTLDQLNAKGIIDQFLQQYGLGQLSDWAWRQIVNGTTDPNQITLQLYDPNSEPGKVVKTLYPEVFMRQQKGLPPMSIGDAVTYRNNAIQVMRAAGLPESFYDQPDDLARFAGNDVSLTELKSRIDDAQAAALQAPEQDRAELHRLYGVDTGHLTAYYLDPDKALPLIQKQWQAAQISGAGARSGFGGLSQAEAQRLAELGVSAGQAQQGLGQLAGMGQLMTALPGEAGGGISREQQLAAAFENNAQAQDQIDRAKRARLAVFGGSGGFSDSKQGVGGLGSAAV